MNITIDETLKALRRKKGNTQEQLASHLGMSVPSVSKWERGEGYPDIELLPLIASYYDVTIDDLLGVGEMRKRERIREFERRDSALASQGRTADRVVLCREMYRELPNEPPVITALMGALMYQDGNTGDPVHNEWPHKDEIVKLGETVLASPYPRGENDQCYYSAIQTLCIIHIVSGDYETAKKYARMVPSYSITCDALNPMCLSGRERFEAYQHNTIQLTELLAVSIGYIAGNGTNANYAVICYETQIRLFELIFPDGDFGFFHVYLTEAYENSAACHTRLGDYDAALSCLEKAADHAIAFDTRVSAQHTSPLVGTQRDDPAAMWKSAEDNCCMELLRNLEKGYLYEYEKELFGPLRENMRYDLVMERLRGYAK